MNWESREHLRVEMAWSGREKQKQELVTRPSLLDSAAFYCLVPFWSLLKFIRLVSEGNSMSL